MKTRERNSTGNRENGERHFCSNLCFLCSLLLNSSRDGVNLYSKREGGADFVFLARDTATPYLDTRPLLTPGKPEIREYKAMFVLNDEEIGIFSHELVVNCSP